MKSTSVWHVVVGCALLYVGAYLSLSTPEKFTIGCSLGMDSAAEIPWWRMPSYRIKSEFVETFFVPLAVLDKFARPQYWIYQVPPAKPSAISANTGFGGSYTSGTGGFGGGISAIPAQPGQSASSEVD